MKYQFQWLTPFYRDGAWHLARLEVIRDWGHWLWFWKRTRQRAEIEVCPNHGSYTEDVTARLEVFADGKFHQHRFDFRFVNQSQLPGALHRAAVRWVQATEKSKATPWTPLERDPLPKARVLNGERA